MPLAPPLVRSYRALTATLIRDVPFKVGCVNGRKSGREIVFASQGPGVEKSLMVLIAGWPDSI